MERLAVAANMTELYDLVLRDTPLGPYFSASLSSEDLDEMNLEILRNTLYKAYLDDFAKFCDEVGGATAEIMNKMMQFEARTRACCMFLDVCVHDAVRCARPRALLKSRMLVFTMLVFTMQYEARVCAQCSCSCC